MNWHLREYWLIFTEGDSFLQRTLFRHYGHLALLTLDNHNWVLYDPTPYQLKLYICHEAIHEKHPILDDKEVRLIKITIDPLHIKKVKFKWWLMLFPRWISCTSIIKYILGVKLKGFTPLGLANSLKKMSKTKDFPLGLVDIKILH